MTERERKYLKIFCAVMTVALLWVLFMPEARAQDHLADYRKYQESVEWPKWLESQPKKRIKAVRAGVKQSKDITESKRKKNKLVTKENRIRKRKKT